MKRLFVLLLLALLSLGNITSVEASQSSSTEQENSSSIYELLKSEKDIVAVEKLESKLFEEKYLVRIEQPIDHKNPELGTFTQRFVVAHTDYNKPVVIVAEGYGGAYGLNPNYRDEISTKLGTNQVVVEHRYFLESTPEPCDWQYMTGENAANDLHRITTILKKVYKNKWISTGISKGGQNTMIYRTYFPDDVDISVPYVGPVCFGVEDGRHEPFIDQCGTPEDRAKIIAYQREVLKRKAAIVPMLEELAQKSKWDFRDMSLEEVIDYCVLEYSFSFWQWGYPTSRIPELEISSDREIFDHLMDFASASYFGEMSIQSFFVQAATDLGYYGYDTKPFKDLLTIKSTKKYLRNIFLPEDAKKIKFNNTLHKDIYKFLNDNDPKMIFVYGEFDPWSAAAPEDYLFENKSNMIKYVQKNGSHSARIATMDKETQEEIWSKINKWLEE
ncbi:MAG: S28 family serine protease [Rikenellaceae bacterium]